MLRRCMGNRTVEEEGVIGSANCWEFMKCEREQECPAYPNNGRTCFSVTGTVCRGETQGTYQEKIKKCREMCDFYKTELTAAH